MPKRHSAKQDGSVMVSGEILEFRVLEFSVENKKILVSHTATYNDEIVAEKKKKIASTKKVMKQLEDNKQQSTLGDLGGLADLKKDLDAK